MSKFNAASSMWLIVFALGLIEEVVELPDPPMLLAIEFFRMRLAPAGCAPLVLSRLPFRGRGFVVPVWWSFCWCLNNRSRRAKHRVHCGHSKGFSFVWDRSWRFRCSSRAKDLPHVVHMCGRGLSVFGGGKGGFVAGRCVATSGAAPIAFLFSEDFLTRLAIGLLWKKWQLLRAYRS